MLWISFIMCLGFSGIHVISRNLKFLNAIPRSRFLLFSCGVAYLIALTGLGVFYGLERYVKRQRKIQSDHGASKKERVRLFNLHIAFFAVYNLITGYLLRLSSMFFWRGASL